MIMDAMERPDAVVHAMSSHIILGRRGHTGSKAPVSDQCRMMARRSNSGTSCCWATNAHVVGVRTEPIMMSVRGLYCMFIKMTSAPPRCNVSTPSSSAALKVIRLDSANGIKGFRSAISQIGFLVDQ